MRQLKAVETLRCVWIQQYGWCKGKVYWREADNLPPHKQLITSPYDTEARNRTKRDTNWTGYAVHLTETCDRDLPHLITNVETTPATTGDVEMTQVIHQALADKHLLPQEHIVDTAYVDAQHLLTSETQLGIELLGPVPPDSSWQQKAKLGFELSCFKVNWEHRHATCPQGHISQSWHQRSDNYGNPVIQVRFRRPDCAACPVRSQCTHSPAQARVLTLKPQPLYEAQAKGRARQHTLRNWELADKISAIRTPSNQRRYDIDSVLGTGHDRITAIYARVSSYKQREDLDRQVSYLQSLYPQAKVFKDIGCGLNFKRKALLALLGQVMSGDISAVVVGHQDRLARFGGDLIKWICEQNNCQLMVLSRNELSPEREMVEDILAIIHVFSCRLYGLRKYKSAIKEDSSLPGNQASSEMEDLDLSK